VTNPINRSLVVGSLLSVAVVTGCGGVSRSDYDALQAKNQALQQEMAADKAQIIRLQGAIKYTVNSDLLFPSGSWQMSAQGKQIIAKMASQLAPMQENKILVKGYTDDAPVGAALQRQGITSNQMLSQKRAENVMQYMISQGMKPDLVSAQGLGDADQVTSNDTAKGRAQNRRVELTLLPESISRGTEP
jgi:chemotaxis protein MotB